MSKDNLYPVSTGEQNINVVWYMDTSAVVVEASGNVIDKRLTYGLTKDTDNNYWVDSAGKIYKNEISGNDISGSLYKYKFYATNRSGAVPVKDLSGNLLSVPIDNLLNVMFQDQAGNPWYTSYTNTIDTALRTAADISFNSVVGSLTALPWITDLNLYNKQSNRLLIDVSAFNFNPPTDASANLDISFNLQTRLNLIPGGLANASGSDVSNNVNIKIVKMGAVKPDNLIFASATTIQTGFIDVSVNALTPNAKLLIESEGALIQADISNNVALLPNLSIKNVIPSSISIPAGANNVRIPYIIPANKIGSWHFTLAVQDGLFTSHKTAGFKISVHPGFVAPIVSNFKVNEDVKSVLSEFDQTLKFRVNLDDSNITSDISKNTTHSNNKLLYNIRVVPNVSNIAVNLNDISLGLSIYRSGTTTNLIDNVLDICSNALKFTDLSSQSVSQLIVTGSDLSFNATTGLWFKLRDISDSYAIDLSWSNVSKLPSRNFNLNFDWLRYNFANDVSKNNLNISTVTKSFSIDAKYSSNVVLTPNKANGTVRLSLNGNANGIAPTDKFNVKIYTDEKLTTLATTADVKWSESTRLLNTLVSQDVSAFDFNVVIGDNFVSDIYIPKQFGTNKLYLVAYISENSTTVHKYTISNVADYIALSALDLSFNYNLTTFRPANTNDIMQILDHDPSDPSEDPDNPSTTTLDLSGYIVQNADQHIDLSFSIIRPAWWDTVNSPSLTITLIDPSNIVKFLDISGTKTDISTNGTTKSLTFTNMSDLCGNFYVDMSFNSTKISIDSIFSLNYLITDADGTIYGTSNKQILFYYKASELANSNLGGNKNTVILYTDVKLALDQIPTFTQMNIGTQDSFGAYSWLAGSSNNMYCLDLARPEFMGETGHTLDLSGVAITVVAADYDVSQTPVAAYFSYGKSGSKIATGTVISASGGSPGLQSNNCISRFVNFNYSYLYVRSFVGTVDIFYNTINRYNKISSDSNKNRLRLVFLPRPTLSIDPITPSFVPINTTSTMQVTIRNRQPKGVTPNAWLSTVGFNPTDVSGNNSLATKIRNIIRLGAPQLGFVTAAGLPDVNANLYFTAQTNATSIAYDSNANPVFATISFKGRNIPGLNLTNLSVTAATITSKIITEREAVHAVVFANSSFSENVYANNVNIGNQLVFAGLRLIQYVALDNTSTTFKLMDNELTKNSAYVVVENKASVAKLVHNGNTTNTIPSLTTVVYRRKTSSEFELLFTKA